MEIMNDESFKYGGGNTMSKEVNKISKEEFVKQATKAQEVKKVEQPKAPAIQVDMIVAKLPDVVKPKDLCALFGYDDGGKTIRRTLRSKFATASGHEHKADWQWKKTDKVLTEIVAYFASRNESKKVAIQ